MSTCKYLLLLTSLLLSLRLAAQTDSREAKNGIKLNLVSLAARNISLQYERGVGKHTALLLGFRLEPKGKVPLKGILQDRYGGNYNVDNFLDNTRLSNVALTPEFRYYFGKRPMNGIYLAPYLRYAHFRLTWGYTYTDEDQVNHPIGFTGQANLYSAGIMVGGQWHLGSRFLIDLWLLGASTGKMETDLNAATDLSSLSSDDQKTLKLLIESTTINGSRLSANVSNAGVQAKGSFTVPGIRTGLCIGFLF